MMCSKRTTITLSLLCLLMSSFRGIGQAQTSSSDPPGTFTISGMVGLPGVVMRGLPGDPITDNNGFYAVRVSQGWAGDVKPTKPGYAFEPQSKSYNSIDRDYKTEDYMPRLLTFTISGNVGLAGVVMKGLPGDPVTGINGSYKAEVPYGWSGKVVPSKEGYEFSPPAREYSSLTSPCPGQDYVARVRTFTISGTTGVSGVRMVGLPDSPVTDEQGAYRSLVPYGWSGSVTPTKPGYLLKPPSKTYQAVTADQVRENYTAIMITFTISGSTGLPGVVMKGLPGDPVASETGSYRAEVPYGWSGTITPSKAGFEFTPASREYPAVVAPHDRQDFQARVRTFTISGNVGISGAAMTGLPGDQITDERGTYQAKVEYGWSGKVMPHKEGYRFEPPVRSYSRVMGDVRNEDYKAQPLPLMVTISEVIRAGNEPIVDVKVTAEPGGYTAMTDSQGRYTLKVPYGWTGSLRFEKPGWTWDPDTKPFSNVTTDIISEPRDQWSPYPRPPATPNRPRMVAPVPAGNVFVIPTTQVMPQKLAETADDLRIMLQIFREKLSEPRLIRGAFVDFGDFFSDRDRAQEAFYLQGSAAVFVLEMEAPFSFAPPQTTEGQAAQESVDVVWQRARQKLYSPQDPARGPSGLAGEAERMDFQQFQEDLLKTFRHAANLRNMEPNESVILMIKARDESAGWPAPAGAGGSYGAGRGAWFEGSSYSTSSSSFGPGGGSTYADSRTRSSGSMAGRGMPGRAVPSAAPATAATVLTIQARKADIDAFAKGSLSFEQFQQHVKTFTY